MFLQLFLMCFKQFLPSLNSEAIEVAVEAVAAEATDTAPVFKQTFLVTDAVQHFVNAVLTLSTGQPLDPILRHATEYEEGLRKIFVHDRGHPNLLNPFVGLLDVFAQNPRLWKVIGRPFGEYHDDHFIMPLSGRLQKKPGTLSIIPTIHEFQLNWNIFTHNVLSNISWDNVVAAGGSVLACLEPFSGNPTPRQRNRRYQTVFATSDIDLFIWGLNASQAEAKMIEIYESICAVVPWEVTCVRKPNVVSIHTIFPARPIQIILRLYLSPAEILAGFDIDSACFAYDGRRVWTSPRALASCIRQSNTIDLTRRSPSYEVRLAKYAQRGYEVYLPSLSRDRIDSSIFCRPSPKHPNGLARLLVLERLYFKDPIVLSVIQDYPWKRGIVQGAIYAGPGRQLSINFQSSDYDVAWVIPYGPRWDAKRIAISTQLINTQLNGPWALYEAGRRLHRHPLYAGSMGDCVGDFCPGCPSPDSEDERQLAASESGQYIRGPIRFLETNPGQQLLTGSFQPLDMKGWEDDAYRLDEVSEYGASYSDGEYGDSDTSLTSLESSLESSNGN